MKIQLDTENKTIKLESDVLLSKLISTLDSLLPNKEWKKYTLETNTIIHQWNNPTIIKTYPTWPQPSYPWFYATTNVLAEASGNLVASSQDNALSVKSGVFNVEVKA